MDAQEQQKSWSNSLIAKFVLGLVSETAKRKKAGTKCQQKRKRRHADRFMLYAPKGYAVRQISKRKFVVRGEVFDFKHLKKRSA